MSKFNLTLDSQQISTFMACPLQWYYKYQENIRLASLEQKIAADKGTLVHKLLDYYYTERALHPEGDRFVHAGIAVEKFKVNKHTYDLFPDHIRDDKGIIQQTSQELEDFIVKRFGVYMTRWFMDDFNVQCVEDKPGVEVGFSKILYEDNDKRYILEGRVDLLNKIGMYTIPHACWVDHKTEGKYNPLYDYKVQFKTYALATGYNYGMVNYFGMQEDKKGELLKNNKLFRRQLIYFHNWMIEEWEQKVLNIFNIIYDNLQMGDRRLSLQTKERMFYHIKNEGSCAGAFDANPCQFTHLCEEVSFDIKQIVKTNKYKVVEPWLPWVPTEI